MNYVKTPIGISFLMADPLSLSKFGTWEMENSLEKGAAYPLQRKADRVQA